MTVKERNAIIDAYKELGSVELVAERISRPAEEVSKALVNFDLRQLYRKMGNNTTWFETDVKQALRLAAKDNEPLTITYYTKFAQENRLPTAMTVSRILGATTWAEACQIAGVKTNTARGRRATSLTKEDCINAVRECIDEHGRVVAYSDYILWARANKKPSGPTLRQYMKWNEAVAQAVEMNR